MRLREKTRRHEVIARPARGFYLQCSRAHRGARTEGRTNVADDETTGGADQPAEPTTGVQDSLFVEGVPQAPAEDIGYRGPTACNVAGITYRQLDYWARTNLVVPSIRDASGSGTQRLYSFRDLVVLKVVKRLLDAGVSLQNIRKAIETLRSRGVDDLAGITLISDGTTVYECRS